jgi:hypothetical protein
MIVRASEKRRAGLFELLRTPPARSYLFIALAALAIYCILMSGRSSAVGDDLGTLLTVVVAVPGLIGLWAASPMLFMLSTTYQLIDPNFTRLLTGLQGRQRDTGHAEDLLLAGTILVYLMAQFRLLSLLHKSMPDDPPPRRIGQREPAAQRRPPNTFAEGEIIVMFVLALGGVLAGYLGWLTIAELERGRRVGAAWGVQRPFAQLAMFFWAFMSAWALAAVVFGYRAWRRMSWAQARMMLHDIGWAETRREQERIRRWQRWLEKRPKKQR